MSKKNKISLLTRGKVHITEEPYPNGTQAFVPIKQIKDGIICTKDGRYVKVLEVLPVNFHLKSSMEQETMIYYFASYLKISPDHLQILVRTQHADIDAYCANMEVCFNREQNQNCKEMILETAQTVNQYIENEAVSRRFYLVFSYEGQSEDFWQISEELEEDAETARQYLDRCGLEMISHEEEDQALFDLFCSLYHRPKIKNPDQYRLDILGSQEEIPEMDSSGKVTTADLLAPDIIDTQNAGYLLVNDIYHAYLYISGYGYPTQNNLAWLSPLLELGDGISVSFYADRCRREEILPKIAQRTRWNRSRLKDIEDTRTDYENLDDAISSGLYIKEEMNRNNEDFWYLHTLIEVTAPNEELLNQRVRQVENACASMDLQVRFAHCKQEQAFLSMLPLAQLDKDLELKLRRNALTTAVAAAFPFTSYELCDDTGVFLGINQFNDTATILDFYDRDKYSSGNIAVFGQTGAGKTFLLLLLAMRLRMLGVKVFIITPEKGFEYRSACEAVGGQYFKIAPGSDDQINLMEIRRTTLDIDSEMEGVSIRKDSVLLDKVQNIHTYLSLRYPAISPEESYQLNLAILECYKRFGIIRNNASLTDAAGNFKPMPDFSDLYEVLQEYPELKNLALVVKQQIEFGMGGQTNVDLHSDFIVLDTSGAKQQDISPCTYIATSFVKDEMSRSRTQKKAIIADELWKIAGDSENTQAADFALELVKTIRGYNGIFISATQNTIDYFALQDGKFGKSLLNNSQFKMLLQMEEAEAMELKDKLGLSEEETRQIVRSSRGQGLLCIGSNRIPLTIISTPTEYDLITTNSSDFEKRKYGREK